MLRSMLILILSIPFVAMSAYGVASYSDARVCWPERRILTNEAALESALYYRHPEAELLEAKFEIVRDEEEGGLLVRKGDYEIRTFSDAGVIYPGLALFGGEMQNRVVVQQTGYVQKGGSPGYGIIYFDSCGVPLGEVN